MWLEKATMGSKKQMDGETLGGEHGGEGVGRSHTPQKNSQLQENVLIMTNSGSLYYVPGTVPSSLRIKS